MPTSIRMDLEGALEKRFNILKEKFGIVNNTDVLRLLIRTYPEETSKVPAK